MKKITKKEITRKFLQTGKIAACIVLPALMQKPDTQTIQAAEQIPAPQITQIFESAEQTYTDAQGILYTYSSDGTCCVSGCTSEIPETVILPEQIHTSDGIYRIKGIEEDAFSECSRLRQIKLPDSISQIPADVFSDCRNLTDICVIPSDPEIKKSKNTLVVSARIHAALIGAAKHVKLEIDEKLMKQAVSMKGTDRVTLTVGVAKPSGTEQKQAVPRGVLLTKAAVQAAADSGKDLKIRLKPAEGRSCYIKINAENMKQAAAELDLSLREISGQDAAASGLTDLKKALKKNGIGTDRIKRIDVSFGRGAKVNVQVIVPADDIQGLKAGTKAYIYRYQKTGHVFDAVFYEPDTVSGQGNLSIFAGRGGSYIISAKPFLRMSRKPVNTFLTGAGGTYYAGSDGAAVYGWKKIGKEYYYFDRESGKMVSGRKADGIRLRADGTAVRTEADTGKIQTMIKARTIMEQVTNPSDSRSQKIEKCFRWVLQFPYRRYRRLMPICRQAGWEVTFANDIFDHHQGCCVSEASATAFLFHECGYPDVYVATDTGHAWVELNGRVYDPLFAESRDFASYYNVPYAGYGMRAVVRHKI